MRVGDSIESPKAATWTAGGPGVVANGNFRVRDIDPEIDRGDDNLFAGREAVRLPERR
jgi:hypothetical protein